MSTPFAGDLVWALEDLKGSCASLVVVEGKGEWGVRTLCDVHRGPHCAVGVLELGDAHVAFDEEESSVYGSCVSLHESVDMSAHHLLIALQRCPPILFHLKLSIPSTIPPKNSTYEKREIEQDEGLTPSASP